MSKLARYSPGEVSVALGLALVLLVAGIACGTTGAMSPAAEPVPIPVWVTEYVAPGGSLNAPALDLSGNPEILYLDEPAETLRYAVRHHDGWQTWDVAAFPVAAPPADLAFDLALDTLNIPHIAYVNTEEDALYYAAIDGKLWQWEVISDGGRLLSLAVSTDHTVHVVLASDTIKYLTNYGGTWRTETMIEPDTYVWNLFLDLDTAGRPHIAWTGATGSFHALRQGPDEWSEEKLDLANIEGFALTPADEPYYLVTEAEEVGGRPPFSLIRLSLAEHSSGYWTYTPLWQAYDWYVLADLAADAGGNLHVVYYDTNGRPHYQVKHSDATLTREFPFKVGSGEISLLLDSTGEPWLAHHDGQSLFLSGRVIGWFDEFWYLPVTHR